MFKNAIVRPPSSNFMNGLTTSRLGAPSLELAVEQHTKYVKTLKEIGLTVEIMDTEDTLPDSCFVEDTAIVMNELAVITTPGAISRRAETATIKNILQKYKDVAVIEQVGATIDGGDVLQIDDTFYIGVSYRTNIKGIKAFEEIIKPLGRYKVVPIALTEGLHLKSSVTMIAKDTVIIANHFKDTPEFQHYKRIVLAPEDEYAANTLLINDTLIMPAHFPTAVELVKEIGINVITLNMSEYQKMDGALTCLSLRF